MNLYDILSEDNKLNWRAVVEVIVDHYTIDQLFQDVIDKWDVFITRYEIFEINRINHEYYKGSFGVILVDAMFSVYTSKEVNDAEVTARNNYNVKLKYQLKHPYELDVSIFENDYNETYGYYSETPLRSFNMLVDDIFKRFHKKKLELS